ncbi:Hsp20/alpha crystallin family protein [Frankia sp. AgB32]|uniref:Hsp20/alpha crystallin family protein n=1 Tax=Frankia sp. AgB32 TaxID=631119 RepID=UPI00200D72A8|nr:Hsp20/alpha crystallin family protein [Frankia sp. AgB32]MCK9894978.1 Hsp20/alpha crystallin family protein [Frankia sp. AgB32]
MALPTRNGPEGVALAGRWDPFREIEEAWSRMGSLLGDVAGGAGRPLGVLAGAALPVDVEETDDAFVVELELPGARREDVAIDLRDNELHVSGEVREREKAGIARRRTRRFGRFEHRVTLPGEVDVEGVTASLSDGVLTVTLPKASRSQPRHIEITIGDAGGPAREAGGPAREAGGPAREAGGPARGADAPARDGGDRDIGGTAAAEGGARPAGYGGMTTGDAAEGEGLGREFR